VLFFPVLLVGFWVVIWLHCCLSWFPLCWADLTVLVRVLECLDKSEDLLDVSTDWKIAVAGVAEHTLSINDESCSNMLNNNLPASNSGVSSSGDESSIDSGNGLGEVRKDWNSEIAKSSFVSRLLTVLKV